jgi:hypothetical protein
VIRPIWYSNIYTGEWSDLYGTPISTQECGAKGVSFSKIKLFKSFRLIIHKFDHFNMTSPYEKVLLKGTRINASSNWLFTYKHLCLNQILDVILKWSNLWIINRNDLNNLILEKDTPFAPNEHWLHGWGSCFAQKKYFIILYLGDQDKCKLELIIHLQTFMPESDIGVPYRFDHSPV